MVTGNWSKWSFFSPSYLKIIFTPNLIQWLAKNRTSWTRFFRTNLFHFGRTYFHALFFRHHFDLHTTFRTIFRTTFSMVGWLIFKWKTSPTFVLELTLRIFIGHHWGHVSGKFRNLLLFSQGQWGRWGHCDLRGQEDSPSNSNDIHLKY